MGDHENYVYFANKIFFFSSPKICYINYYFIKNVENLTSKTYKFMFCNNRFCNDVVTEYIEFLVSLNKIMIFIKYNF